MKELPTTRVPLAELPLSDYVRDPNLPLSPVSLPLKRPATPKAATATPKRVVVELDADELGTGRSPARRLFDATPRASKIARAPFGGNTAGGDGIASSSSSSGSSGSSGSSLSGSGISGNTSVGGLAPSPPLRSRRGSDALPTPVSSTSSSTSSNTPSNGRVHDPGFVIFSDDDVLARPVSQLFVPVSDTDEENIPPEVEVEVEATPRRKRFEPSKLSTVTTSSSSSVVEEKEQPAMSGKQGMIDEADEV
ncbi:hypothetical protein A1Q1_02245 [Trichosporon asahii var. asahii CBS 2479]|uniref:Uncharacterized protein n=1 Tax=Trichosporon asahii var. asahii (strain ATCC 90039 / CBS 2479 / JCM 2466 / KCTC 7840 / NBRC 103889/ NCYC 2677 / UAMH 7654) TaxID=1186058 RepID=J4UCH6_TRIAS|nr:hypothetical protein A1Q1_02245 [Trichosporon asahii var. asahii CBS 2479]EJT48700.1 hypothetical protein A1Q1_02245 [Trichosporon asahii var. asahii CBS 2479]